MGLSIAIGVSFADAVSSKNAIKIQSEGCVEGTAASSRAAAEVDARRNAVRIWLETELGEPPSDRFQPMFDTPDRYTASSRLLRVHPSGGKTCAELEVYLNEWALRADTATLLLRERATPPKVAFLFVEEDATKNSRVFQDQTRASKLFAKSFAAKGLTVISAGTVASGYTERELLSISEAGPAALARYGAEQGADAVVAVETQLSAKPQASSPTGVRARAQVIVRTVGASDARLHDRSEGSAEIDCADAASGHGFALSDAVYKVQDRAMVAAILSSAAGTRQQVRLTLEGVGDFGAAERFVELLRGVTGVSGAKVVSARNGSALLQFGYAGKMSVVVDRLLAGGAGLPKLDVVKAGSGEMVLRVVP